MLHMAKARPASVDSGAIRSVIDLRDISLSDIIGWNTSLRHVPGDVFCVGHGGFDQLFNEVNGIFGRFSNESSFLGGGRLGILNIPEPSSYLLALMVGFVGLSRRR
jgi:hypothetical protein